ncbi:MULTISPECIES: hypothetical protein [unclassified Sinorhizobium]|uniref:hypothetical protein n=1 Tax=unclassified Sinorhizobium TaxID=2613772 RepID=UPI0024C38CA2|nr:MULTISPECIES: hypothetical protein [unclassified Sinorhizobium]MDK1374347.1 hypothetical protein [Sinorhizobium sp. 6-70]MDK1482242.1 hypothetical protein [Sinorhizobium sp. 6-117]
MTSIADALGPLALTGRLLARFWPQLLLIAAVGYIVRDLLLRVAVAVGLQHPLGGMVVLSLVVLSKLVVVVMMFLALRPGLPALASVRQQRATPDGRERNDRVLALVGAAILPFFAYYAAWGFLGDTVRGYSRLALSKVAFGEKAQFFDILSSQGLLLSIGVCWLVRWGAKRMNKQTQATFWRLLVVAADASWIFIGLYGLAIWKDEFVAWLGAGPLSDAFSQSSGLSLITTAHAAETFLPIEVRKPDWITQSRNLFFYALLPMVWLVMAAIIYGYELSRPNRIGQPSNARAKTWCKWLSDFIEHFVSDYRSRYGPVWTCLKLTLGSGLATLLVFIVAYRMIGWIGAWLWFGATRLIGVQDLTTWQMLFDTISVFIGSPSDLDGGILLDAARIALLAAVLEHAAATQLKTAAASAVPSKA